MNETGRFDDYGVLIILDVQFVKKKQYIYSVYSICAYLWPTDFASCFDYSKHLPILYNKQSTMSIRELHYAWKYAVCRIDRLEGVGGSGIVVYAYLLG